MANFKEGVAEEFTQTTEKMDKISFEKEVQELNEEKGPFEESVENLKKDIEDFCKSEAK